MLIDTHCHLSFNAFNDDYKDVIKRAQDAKVQMITVGAAQDTSEKAVSIAGGSDGVFACIGIHPIHAKDGKFDAQWFAKACDDKNVVAIGECGIDYYHLGEDHKNEILKAQQELLIKHLEIAKEKDLPVILHARDAKNESFGASYEHLYRLIKDFRYYRCVVHCFGHSWDWAQKFLDLGLLISFTGIITFKNASQELIDVVRKVPQDKYMIETDAPYLAPEPMRGKQNEPAYVEYVAKGVAQIRSAEYDDIAVQTAKTAKKFFNI